MVIGKVHMTEQYARIRVRNPKDFQRGSFRTLDVGKRGGTKVVIGRLKGQPTTTTQAVLVARSEYTPKIGRMYLKKYSLKRS